MRKLFYNFIYILFFLIFLLFCYNYFYDPFSIFTSTSDSAIKNKYFYPNPRYLKIKYLLNNKTKYDSFLFGSCDSNLLNLQEYGNFYNITYEDNTLWETKRNLSFMINNGFKIKKVLLQLSDECLKVDMEGIKALQKNYPYHYLPYPITIGEKLFFYYKFLVHFPYVDKKLYKNWEDKSKNNFFKSGSFTDKLCLKQCEKRNTLLFKNNDYPLAKFDYIDLNLQFLSEIVQICKKNNIELIVFIVPEYYKIYQQINVNEFSNFKKKIAQITDFYDFTINNPIQKNPEYFYDPYHINNYTSRLIAEKIFTNKRKIIPPPPELINFGVFVTKNNSIKIYSK